MGWRDHNKLKLKVETFPDEGYIRIENQILPITPTGKPHTLRNLKGCRIPGRTIVFMNCNIDSEVDLSGKDILVKPGKIKKCGIIKSINTVKNHSNNQP